MKTQILFLLLILLSSCYTTPKSDKDIVKKDGYVIKVIDSCEYIEYDYGVFDHRVYSLTHKGNCKFCAERAKNLK